MYKKRFKWSFAKSELAYQNPILKWRNSICSSEDYISSADCIGQFKIETYFAKTRFMIVQQQFQLLQVKVTFMPITLSKDQANRWRAKNLFSIMQCLVDLSHIWVKLFFSVALISGYQMKSWWVLILLWTGAFLFSMRAV